MNLRAHTLVSVDFIEAYDYYESKSKGLGERFITEIESAYLSIQKNPLRARIIKGAYRLVNLSVFPFQIIYTFNKNLNRISIVSIHHASKHPGKRFRKF